MHRAIPSLSAAGLLCLVCCVTLSSAGDANVTWITPSDGDVYGSGDTIVGRWSTDKAVVSPSFRICVTDDGSTVSSRKVSEDESGEDDDDDDDDDDTGTDKGAHDDSGSSGDSSSCGAAVWPTIEQSDGSYFVHMSLPNVSSVATCFLEMVDDFGHKMASPAFSYGASTEDTSSSEATDPTTSLAAGVSSASTTPSGPSDVSKASTPPDTPNTANTPDIANTPNIPNKSKTANSPNASKTPNASNTPNTSNASNVTMQVPNTPQTLPSLDESHVPVPTAAYAVPLSLVISVILAAAGLSVHQRRKLQTERLQEQETLKTRGVLSRHSTLSFAGFTKLGSGPRPPTHDRAPQPESRSTSVSMLREWQRGVSRHDRRLECDSRASDTTLAWRTDDGGSVEGYTNFPRREARRPTREPFHASHARDRRTTVPASTFRAGVSPVFPSTDSWGGDRESMRSYAEDDHRGSHKAQGRRYVREQRDYDDDDEDWGRLKRKGRTLVDPGVEGDAPRGRDAYLNASVNDSVLDRYIIGSPAPPSPEPRYRARSPPPSVSRPERLHVRRYAEADGDEKVLPPVPRDPERALYDSVARKISRDP
ncbi:hypothetical protein VTO73DRAFT_1485 [Trametes versicolor]